MRAFALVGAVLVIVAPLAARCSGAAAGVTPSASVTTSVQGWEHWFRLDWEAMARPEGRRIDGYIYNNYGTAAANVQILAQGVDGSGNVVGQKIAWVPGTVPALNRSYFQVTGLPAAPQYRVSVWAFDFVQSPSGPEW
jgi:hypothetical protein